MLARHRRRWRHGVFGRPRAVLPPALESDCGFGGRRGCPPK